LDHYIVALAEFYTDFERESHGADHETAPTAAEVQGAYAALQADPDAPKFIEGTHHAVTSPALGRSFEAVDFPGTKIAMVYPFFRAAFSDLSNTLAMAIIAFFAIEFWGFSAFGFGYLGKFFVAPWKSPIMTFVGFLELLSEFIRVISFAFRLFGNIFAGSVLLLILTFLVPFIAPIGIYGLEVFVGLIQAIVFSLLLLVFAVGAVEHHGEDDHHDGHEGGDADAHTHGHHETGAVQAH
ncbi:MAG TPA: F0F1 ATP synthase subunit A, partial [Tepidiformaceae bacterium]|nr:F0F1 ATP synthase subunit A [Tepidiformaceae bacterium]